MDADLIPTSWEKRGNIITVVGVGGGGSNAVSYMYTLGLKDVDFVICNTDVQALQSSPVPNKLQIGAVLTKGLGAGTDYNVGRKAAQESLKGNYGHCLGKTMDRPLSHGIFGNTIFSRILSKTALSEQSRRIYRELMATGDNCAEVARRLGLPPATVRQVKSRVTRMIAAFKKSSCVLESR